MGREADVSAKSGLALSDAPSVQIVLAMDPITEEKLGRLARAIGGDTTDVFQRALSLFTLAVEAEGRGNRMAIVDGSGRVVTEITGVRVDGE